MEAVFEEFAAGAAVIGRFEAFVGAVVADAIVVRLIQAIDVAV